MKTFNFTKTEILKLPRPSKGMVTYKDTKEKGLSLYITATGTITFFIRKRINGQDQRITLGSFPELTVDTMTAVDVNSGADKNRVNANLEAAIELARQLRIRNIGGIVMVDFITMKSAAENKKILDALNKALSDDPCTVICHGITKLGLFELSRQRRTPTLEEKLIMVENGGDDEE